MGKLLNSVILEGYLLAKTMADGECVFLLGLREDSSLYNAIRCETENLKLRKAIKDHEIESVLRVVGSIEVKKKSFTRPDGYTFREHLTCIEVNHIEFKSEV